MARRGKLILQAAAVLVVVLLVALLGWRVAEQEEGRGLDDALRRGERPPPPALVFETLDGEGEISLADYRGKAVVLNFWASWCEPCRDELPLIEKAHKRLAAQGGTVVGIDVKENSGAALKAVDEFGLTFPNLRDRDGSFVRKWGQTGYPENFVIDREGRVAAVRRFPVTQKWLDETLPPLLDEQT